LLSTYEMTQNNDVYAIYTHFELLDYYNKNLIPRPE